MTRRSAGLNVPSASYSGTRELLVLALALLAALITGLRGPEAARGEAVIAGQTRATPVKAFDGWVVWSAYDSRVRGYQLMAYHSGEVSRLPASPQRTPFDVDLGPDSRGHPTAVYSRCGRPPRDPTRPAEWVGCDVFRLSLIDGHEQRLSAISRTDASEMLPTIWRNRVIFQRVYASRKGIAGFVPHLYVWDSHTGAVRPLRGGPRGAYHLSQQGRLEYGGPGATSLDLRGSRLAYTWEYDTGSCGDPTIDGDMAWATSLWLEDIGGSNRRIESVCGNHFAGLSLAADDVFYTLLGPAGATLRLRLYTVRSRSYAEGSAGDAVLSATRDRAVVYVTRYRQPAPVEIVKADPVRWSPARRVAATATAASGGKRPSSYRSR